MTTLLKGAPERVLAKCTSYLKDGQLVAIDDEFKAKYEEAYSYMASRGHRVIGCAQKELNEDKYPEGHVFSKQEADDISHGLCFVGLVSLEDPPKHGVREAIGTLRLAGIRVMMVRYLIFILFAFLIINLFQVTGEGGFVRKRDIILLTSIKGDHPKTAVSQTSSIPRD